VRIRLLLQIAPHVLTFLPFVRVCLLQRDPFTHSLSLFFAVEHVKMEPMRFFEYSRSEISHALGSEHQASRLFKTVYREFRAAAAPYDFQLPAIESCHESSDGACRYLIRLADGQTVECVSIPERGRVTFCVSSQVGCALACKFCLTGLLGLTRNLTAGEIVAQVVLLKRELSESASKNSRISVVLMGMGEPLQNYENVLKAIEIISDHHGLAVALHRITLSTAGLLPGIQRLASEPFFPNLSISLTGATDHVRDELMPINRKYPIAEVVAAVARLLETQRKRVMFEYVMIKGVTDSLDDARRLADLLGSLGSKVNLIPLNESSDIPYQRTDRSDILQFQKLLVQNGIATFIRRNRGNDVSAACGQLKSRLVTQGAKS
jgi:23S rRNA (adenine2503-C2)-methyltransferase